MNINEQKISDVLDKFASKLKISDDIYDEIRSRRDKIIEFVKEFSRQQNLKIVGEFNLGSYKIRTGVKYHDNDFDIDYGIVLEEGTELSDAIRFKEKLIPWIREKLNNYYKLNVTVKDKKPVVTIKFMNNLNKPNFHIDFVIYVKPKINSISFYKNDELLHLRRTSDNNSSYELKISDPKATFNRQSKALDESNGKNSKRNAILILKHLFSRNHLRGITSIYITDLVISLRDDDTFNLIKKFLYESSWRSSFNLK
ncbi:hypothetical protein ASO20_00180 [Mycoplasma sp. (ex Biomphalaria glabrata)]|uniref:nucleotidyltransferase domain-containing protein n=1 Tax=Mycoplasma sp. (ex Biomphalaria glabrata) TaxID=1749074 RepID=UPI00073AAD12|nr:nucleotidyltransferase [Mycoplasma sp. (ex Biomphalaria glabrata)]ALV23098.1 hypothetical protein ASO20_00180 [Mycoplasma sp. (ex Biomphalaria glabrata)]